MNLSIIIVSWNTRALLARCLESIFAYPPGHWYEVIVVDNASSDGSPEMVRKGFAQTRLIENHENIGFARANNLGILQCQGQAIMLLNPDTEIKPGAFQAILQFLDDHPKTGAAGPRILNPDGSLQFSCSPTPTLFRETLRLFHLPGMRPDGYYPMDRWDQTTPRRADILMGACMVIRREALDQAGLLDEDYFMYSEEVDLCSRLGMNGWELYWVPTGQVVHYGGQSTQQVAQEMFLRLYESKLNYFRKHRGSLATLTYKLVLVLAAFLRLSLIPFALLESPARRSNHLRLADNYRRLLAALPGL